MLNRGFAVAVVLCSIMTVSCEHQKEVSGPAEGPAAFNADSLRNIDSTILRAIQEKQIPGAAFWLERNGRAYHKAYGNRAVAPTIEPMTEETIFDAASLTKVVAGTPAILLLIERGQIQLEDTVAKFIPEFAAHGKEKVTVRHLLTHTSGLRPDVNTRPVWEGHQTAIRLASGEKLQTSPGESFRYSDINLFLVGESVERVSKRRLEEFCASEIYRPLKMNDTGFLPDETKRPRIAPTEPANGEMLRGRVHDPTARFMGGVAGHAGIFTTAHDLARYARMMLNEGTLEGTRIFRPETVRMMTRVQTPPEMQTRRGLGWDIDSAFSRPRGRLFPLGSYGHTGFTGTALWIDPFSKTFYVFLSNRLHPDGKGNVLGLYSALGTLAAQAVPDFDFRNVAGALAPRPTPLLAAAVVLNGVDVLKKDKFKALKGRRVGLVTNHTGVDRERTSTIDLLQAAPEVKLVALFSPEHGIRGEFDENVKDTVDKKSGLPVYSLYGERRAPAPEQLAQLDALVFDIQDIGCRFYTYIATLGHCLEAATKARIQFVVLDRINPVDGITVEGPVYTGPSSFTAYHPLPLRHAMTVGELARMFNAERGWNCNLLVVPLEGWSRNMFFDETGLPWINPSPNMRSLSAALLYPGIGLHERALSVGRGTPRPFEIVGAPFVDPVGLEREIDAQTHGGLKLTVAHFTPGASTFKDTQCHGWALEITDRNQLRSVDFGIELARLLYRAGSTNFSLEKVQHLLQDEPSMEAIRAGKSVAEIKKLWEPGLENFKKRREKFLLYP